MLSAVLRSLKDVSERERERIREALQTALADGSLAVEFAIKEKNSRILSLEAERRRLRSESAAQALAIEKLHAAVRAREEEAAVARARAKEAGLKLRELRGEAGLTPVRTRGGVAVSSPGSATSGADWELDKLLSPAPVSLPASAAGGASAALEELLSPAPLLSGAVHTEGVLLPAPVSAPEREVHHAQLAELRAQLRAATDAHEKEQHRLVTEAERLAAELRALRAVPPPVATTSPLVPLPNDVCELERLRQALATAESQLESTRSELEASEAALIAREGEWNLAKARAVTQLRQLEADKKGLLERCERAEAAARSAAAAPSLGGGSAAVEGALQAELARSQGQLEGVQQQLGTTQQQLTATQEQLARKLAEWDAAKSRAVAQLQQLRAERKRADEQRERAEGRARELEEQLVQLQADLSDLQSGADDEAAVRAAQAHEIASLKQSLQQAVKRHEHAAEMARQAQIEETRALRTELERQIHALAAHDVQSAAAAPCVECEGLRATVSGLRAELAAIAAAPCGDCAELRAQADALRAEVVLLQAEEAALSDARAHSAHLETRLQVLNGELEELRRTPAGSEARPNDCARCSELEAEAMTLRKGLAKSANVGEESGLALGACARCAQHLSEAEACRLEAQALRVELEGLRAESTAATAMSGVCTHCAELEAQVKGLQCEADALRGEIVAAATGACAPCGEHESQVAQLQSAAGACPRCAELELQVDELRSGASALRKEAGAAALAPNACAHRDELEAEMAALSSGPAEMAALSSGPAEWVALSMSETCTRCLELESRLEALQRNGRPLVSAAAMGIAAPPESAHNAFHAPVGALRREAQDADVVASESSTCGQCAILQARLDALEDEVKTLRSQVLLATPGACTHRLDLQAQVDALTREAGAAATVSSPAVCSNCAELEAQLSALRVEVEAASLGGGLAGQCSRCLKLEAQIQALHGNGELQCGEPSMAEPTSGPCPYCAEAEAQLNALRREIDPPRSPRGNAEFEALRSELEALRGSVGMGMASPPCTDRLEPDLAEYGHETSTAVARNAEARCVELESRLDALTRELDSLRADAAPSSLSDEPASEPQHPCLANKSFGAVASEPTSRCMACEARAARMNRLREETLTGQEAGWSEDHSLNRDDAEDMSEVARELAQELAAMKLSHAKQMKQVQQELRKALAAEPSRAEDGSAAIQVLHDREVQRLQAEIRKLSNSHSVEQVWERSLGKSLAEIRADLLDVLRGLRSVTSEGDGLPTVPRPSSDVCVDAGQEVASLRDAIDLLAKTKDKIVGGEAPPPWLLRGYRTALSITHTCLPAAGRQSGVVSRPGSAPLHRGLTSRPGIFSGGSLGRYSRIPNLTT